MPPDLSLPPIGPGSLSAEDTRILRKLARGEVLTPEEDARRVWDDGLDQRFASYMLERTRDVQIASAIALQAAISPMFVRITDIAERCVRLEEARHEAEIEAGKARQLALWGPQGIVLAAVGAVSSVGTLVVQYLLAGGAP